MINVIADETQVNLKDVDGQIGDLLKELSLINLSIISRLADTVAKDEAEFQLIYGHMFSCLEKMTEVSVKNAEEVYRALHN